MIDVFEVLQHWHAGRPKSVVASSLGVDQKTVRKYVRPAEDAGLSPGGPPLSRTEWAELVARWFPELVDHLLPLFGRNGQLCRHGALLGSVETRSRSGRRPADGAEHLAGQCRGQS